MKKSWLKIIILSIMLVFAVALTACELQDPSTNVLYYINDNAANQLNKDSTTKDQAIDKVTDSITNLRSYLDNETIASTGYYMGMEFNVDTQDPITLEGGNFRLKIQAHLYTYKYTDDDGNPIYKYYDKRDGKYYDTNNEEGTRELISAEDIHNEVIKKSNILIEWYNGTTNEMLIGMYFDGINNNSEDPGNILYLNIQGSKRSFPEFGDTVLYRQLIRLLMSLSVESLLTAGNVQGDAGVSSLRSLFSVAVNDNYKVVLNAPVTSVLFYSIAADAIASSLTGFIQGIFAPFQDKIDPLTLKYLGFDFSVVGSAIINSVNSDMQFFTEPDPNNVKEIMTGAYLTFSGASLSRGSIFNYVSDVTFEYGPYPPEEMELDKLYYKEYDYGNYEFVGNLYVPMLNSNFDALIRTDMQQYDNSINNVFMEFTDIANGELMMGMYYKNERTYLDISGLEYMYGWIDLNALGFPKVYDESINLADLLGKMFNFLNNGIVSIVDAILSPDKNDKENQLLEYIMEKTVSTKKTPDDIFSKNTVTLTVDMYLIKHALEETGQGTYTTRQIINILDSLMPYTMDQIAIMLGVSSAEVMLDNTYFTFTLNVDTNEITVKMFTNVGVKPGEPSVLIFQLDVIPTHVGEYVDIAEVNFDNFKPLEQIYTYSATMNGNFVFSTAETVDMSRLLSATLGENSGKNTPYILPQKAGLTFKLVYDQFVTDQLVDGVLKKAGRSAFELTVWLTGKDSEVIIRLASDDVAFNNEVYQNQPERAAELGYVWVSIECVKEGITQKIPKVKVREDVFMTSMQAYMNGTTISDDASELNGTDVNLSITSILFALVEDSYVVAQPKQLEITTSNETVQSIFRVRGLIGNIKVDAGFTYRVEGLENIKNDYGMYKVGQFTDMEGNSPYDTKLHDTIPIYFYEDYHTVYDDLYYDLRVDRVSGVIQVYELGGKVSIYRETINYSADSFFNSEDQNNQDISRVRFNYNKLKNFIFREEDVFYYITYDNERVDIDPQYIKIEGGEIFIYYLGISDRVHHESGAEYCYYDRDKAVIDGEGNYVYYYPQTTKNFLFNYDLPSIEITEAAKTQYAPRIEGSFMGTIRRYILVITSVLAVERGKLFELNSKEFYSVEDETNIVEEYDEDGVKISEELRPIVLYVMEPCLPLAQSTAVNIKVGNNTEIYTLPSEFQIDWSQVTLKGYMTVTEVIIAKGMMGEASYPVRIIVTNREILTNERVSVYTENNDKVTSGVPVVDSIEIDPYDYMLAKYEYFSNIDNFNPDQYSLDENSPDYYLTQFKLKEKDFINQYFSQYTFNISFNYLDSVLYAEGVKSEYIATGYTNGQGDTFEPYEWNFDRYENGTYLESDITATDGNVLYLHTYFKGQLIALNVNVGVRKFSHLKFYDNDNFDVGAANPEGSTAPKIYGHYVANYFDEDSYTIPTNPTFVFTDGGVRTYEKVFDLPYISGLNSDGNYIFTDMYGLQWGDSTITNIGSLGSYYWENEYNEEGEVVGMVLVNRPFYISHVDKDENGVITNEGTPTPGPSGNDSDVDTTSLNMFWLLRIFKPIRDNIGRYTGEYKELSILSGTSTDNGFSTIVLRITVECPKLEVAKAQTESGTPIQEGDEMDTDGENGPPIVFTPSAIKIGTNSLGYYLIDPLNAATNVIPRDITLFFINPDKPEAGMSSHNFKNVEWYSYIPTTVIGEGEDQHLVIGDGEDFNASGHQIIRMEDGKYYFNLPTNEPMTTRIMAKIGSDLSGYQLIVLCIKVLSKDPQNVDFYYGNIGDVTKHISGIEKVNVSVNDDGGVKAEEYAIYTYYVNTFASFNIPTWIRAYFGANSERSELYNVTWQQISSDEVPIYRPDSMLSLMAIIGDGDVTIRIYLVVIVANYTISNIELVSELSSYYVKVGDNASFLQVFELLQLDINNHRMGLYEIEGIINNYILLSTGGEEDGEVETGKLGLYNFVNGQYVLVTQMYPYDFLQAIYSGMNLYFQNSSLVNYVQVSNYYTYMYSEETMMSIAVKLEDAITFYFSYDAASRANRLNIAYQYTDVDDFKYNIILDENERLRIYTDAGMVENTSMLIDVHELTNMLVHQKSAEDIREKVIEEVVTASGNLGGNGKMLSEIYTFLSGNLNYYSPLDPTERISFVSIRFTDATIMTFEEVNYRLLYLERNRRQDAIVSPIRNKVTSIRDFAGIFSVNDIVREAINKEAFVASNNFVVSLGTGRGAFDMTLRIVFDGGLRVSVDSMASQTIDIDPYNANGTANYGTSGYSLALYVSAAVKVIKQDNTGTIMTYYYGDEFGANTAKLTYWYVRESTYSSLPVGTVITYIPQSIIYSSEGGSLTITTLTEEGFRLTRVLNFTGVPDRIENYNSILPTGLLIRNGRINISDIYNYIPVNGYFGGTAYIPKEITATLSGKQITISNVQWNISTDWYNNVLADLSFIGTNNMQRVIATASILGWESYEEGVLVFHDRISITLYIVIDSAEIATLPWLNTSLKLQTLPIKEIIAGNETTVHCVEMDAFNDADSGAVSNTTFILPSNIITQYVGGAKHTFYGVRYLFRNVEVTYIPYNNLGIDIMAISQELSLNINLFVADHIDLQVNLGLGQTLTIRFRFYNKTVTNVSADISLTNTSIRNQIYTALTSVSANESEKLIKSVNLVRIQSNIEKMIENARIIRNNIVIPLSQDIVGLTSYAAIMEALLGGFEDITPIEDVGEYPLGSPYSGDQCYNYALPRLIAEAQANAETYAKAILNIINTTSLTLRVAAVKKQIDDYITLVFNRGYDKIINDYIKEEMSRMFIAELNNNDSYNLSYASYYKNYIEASFNVQAVISSIYRLREQTECGIYDAISDAQLLKGMYMDIVAAAVNDAIAAAKAKVNTPLSVSSIIDNILWMRLGIVSSSGSQYDSIPNNIEFFAVNDIYKNKVELRTILKDMMSDAMDFSLESGGFDIVSNEITELIPVMVNANIDSISNFNASISAIRRNLVSAVDIGSLLNTVFERGINYFVTNIFMEMHIATAIKRVQKINTSTDGYYYIDPYYDYTIIPNTFIADFEEDGGGHSYYFTTIWDNDTVSSNITYKGNAKNDLYGYIYSWYQYYNMGSNNQNTFLNDILTSITTGLAGISWNQILDENQSESNTISLINDLVYSFYPDTVTSNEEERKIELYTYYRAGIAVLGYSENALRAQNVTKATLIKFFNSNKYDEVISSLYNRNTAESQIIKLVVIVNNRTLNSADLVVRDEDDTAYNVVEINNPYENTVASIPHYINVNGERMEIIWKNVSIRPEGNLSLSSQRIYGYIKNDKIGQEVSILLYVHKWSYSGVYDQGVSMNPLNFYFNDYIENSARESYVVRFEVLKPTFDEYGDPVRDAQGKIVTTMQIVNKVFYPEDSVLLENTTSDSDMQQIQSRKNYTLYWDAVSKSKVLQSKISVIAADLYLGNEKLGQISINNISVNDPNVPKKANYHYENMQINGLKVVEVEESYELYAEMEDNLFGLDGLASIVMNVDSVYPITGEVRLWENYIHYEPDDLTVRFLWNNTYDAAISKLRNFIADSYKEVEEAAREQYALNILMNFGTRTEMENEELLTLACKYVAKLFYANTDNIGNTTYATKSAEGEYVFFSEGCIRDAKALLMLDERYDFAQNTSRLKGGADGTKIVTVLIRVGSNAVIYKTTRQVRVLFSDYNPIAYYNRTVNNIYTRIGSVNADNLPSSLYLALRRDYWDISNSRNQYISDGKGPTGPYNNISDFSYMLLHYSNKKIDGIMLDNETIGGVNYNLRLKNVTDIVYGTPENGIVRSTSFVIDGIRYNSNLISLNVA